MGLLMVTVSAQNLCRFGRKTKFSEILLVNFENHLFLSRGTADCELVDTDIALNIKYVLENYFWSIETSSN